jgi:hypothetical protein
MIFYKNYGPRLRTKQDEIEAIRRCVGMDAQEPDGTPAKPFELIELVKRKASPVPTKIHGFQDTDVKREQDGSLYIIHRRAGEGTLRFEPSPYGNPVGYLARTEHNIRMLVQSHRAGEWTITDRATTEEVKKAYEKWWAELPEKDKKAIQYQEELKTRDRFQIPTVKGDVKTDYSEDNLLKEIAELKEANRQLQELAQPLPTAPVAGVAPAPPQPRPEPEKPESPAPSPEKKTDPWVITLKNGDTINFHELRTFKTRALGPKYGLHFKNTDTMDFMVPKIIEKIKQVEAQESAA